MVVVIPGATQIGPSQGIISHLQLQPFTTQEEEEAEGRNEGNKTEELRALRDDKFVPSDVLDEMHFSCFPPPSTLACAQQ